MGLKRSRSLLLIVEGFSVAVSDSFDSLPFVSFLYWFLYENLKIIDIEFSIVWPVKYYLCQQVFPWFDRRSLQDMQCGSFAFAGKLKNLIVTYKFTITVDYCIIEPSVGAKEKAQLSVWLN